MTKEITKGNYEIKCALQLYDSVLMNKLLFNCQAWSRLTDQDLKGLEKIQLQTLKQIVGVPYSTSNVRTYMELGIFPVRHIINKRRLGFLHHILNLKETDPVYKVYTEQKKWLQERNWANEIYETRLLYSLTFSDQEIKAMSKRQWKSIEKYVHSTLCEQAASASKTKMICQKQTFKQQQYILQLPAAVARRASK